MVVVVLLAGQDVVPRFLNTTATRGVDGEISTLVEGDDGHGGHGGSIVQSAVIVGGETEKFDSRIVTSTVNGIAWVEEGHSSAMVQLLEVGVDVVGRRLHEGLGW